jgi:copper chaperone CopZ
MKPGYKFFLLTGTMLVASLTVSHAQINNAKTTTVHVWGNCGMCENTIETSALKKNEAKADWNRETKMAVITYDSTKTDLNAVLKRIADAGYDNEMYTAPDKAYDKLHMCCKYDRKPE